MCAFDIGLAWFFLVMFESQQQVVVVILSRTPWKYVGLPLQDFVRVLAFDQIEKLAVAVEVVEVFEQPEIKTSLTY